MGCIRSPYRELRDQESYPSQDRNQEQRGKIQESAAFLRLFFRLGQRNQHHRSRVLSLDPVDLLKAVQGRTGLQNGDAYQLVYLL